MEKQPKNGHVTIAEGDLWINPKSNIKSERGDRAFDTRLGIATSSRLLELADIALGLKKPQPKKKKAAVASGTHTSEKTEPYSS
jgi:hypothetical protein